MKVGFMTNEQLLTLVRYNLGEDPEDHETYLLPDSALEVWAETFDMNPDLVTARALRVIAANETLRSKKISTQDLSTDGPAVSAELRAVADIYEGAGQQDQGGTHFSGFIPARPKARVEAEEYRYGFR